MDKIPCTGNDATENQYRVTGNPNNPVVILRFAISADRGRSIIRARLLVELDSVRCQEYHSTKTTYCINKIKNGYKDLEKK